MTDLMPESMQRVVKPELEVFNLMVESLQATLRPNSIGQEFKGAIEWETGLIPGQEHRIISLSGLVLGSLRSENDDLGQDHELGRFDRLHLGDGGYIYWPHRINEIRISDFISGREQKSRPMHYYPSSRTRLGLGTSEMPCHYDDEGPAMDIPATSRNFEQLKGALLDVRAGQAAWFIGTKIVGEAATLPFDFWKR